MLLLNVWMCFVECRTLKLSTMSWIPILYWTLIKYLNRVPAWIEHHFPIIPPFLLGGDSAPWQWLAAGAAWQERERRRRAGGFDGRGGEGFDDSELIYSLIRVMYCIARYCMVSYGFMVLHGFYGIAWALMQFKRGRSGGGFDDGETFGFLLIRIKSGFRKSREEKKSILTPILFGHQEISTEYDNRKANSRPLPPSVTFWSPLLFY